MEFFLLRKRERCRRKAEKGEKEKSGAGERAEKGEA
jgi:hypothetical protein